MCIRTPGCLFLLLGICGLIGCGRFIPFPDGPGTRITEVPPQSELIGTWRLTTNSINQLKRLGFKGDLSNHTHTVRLSAEGKCEVNAYGSYSVGFEPSYISGPGTWRTATETNGWSHYVAVHVRLPDQNPSRSLSFCLARDEGKLVLWWFMTDPDDRIYYEFAKD